MSGQGKNFLFMSKLNQNFKKKLKFLSEKKFNLIKLLNFSPHKYLYVVVVVVDRERKSF